MKFILLGGLDPRFRDQVRRAFLAHPSEFELHSLTSTKELRECLAGSQGDLLVLDLDFSGGLGMEWLATISDFQAPLSILAIGQDSTPDVRGYEQKFPGRFFPLVKYLQKPVTANALVEAAMDELRQATWGIIQGLSLPSLLQMLNMEQKTCTIRVTSGRRNGFFYMRDGQIINARYRRLEGMEAVPLLIGVPSPKMEIDSRLHDTTQRINLRLEEILMMAAQVQDESALETFPGTEASGGEESDAIPLAEVGKWGRPAVPPPPKTVSLLHRSRWLVAGPILLALLAGGSWWLFHRPVDVVIQSSPPGAVISLNGISQGLTPLHLNLPRPLQGILALHYPGHQLYEHQLQPGDRSLNITLQAATLAFPAEAPVASLAPTSQQEPTLKTKGKKRSGPSPKSDIFDQLRKQKE